MPPIHFRNSELIIVGIFTTPSAHTVPPPKSQCVLFYVSVEISAGEGRSSISTSGVPKSLVKGVRQARGGGENILSENADQGAGVSPIWTKGERNRPELLGSSIPLDLSQLRTEVALPSRREYFSSKLMICKKRKLA